MLELRDGERVEEFLSVDTALVDVQDRKAPAFVQSSLPLLAEDEDGRVKPVRTRLMGEGDHVEPANAVNPTEIPDDLSDGIVFENEGFSVGVPGGGAAAPGSMAEGNVFYGDLGPGAGEDVDFLVKPLPTGVEAFWVLRSAESPERLELDIEVPEGQGVQVDTMAGGTRYRPYAKDANGSVLGLEDADGSIDADERYQYDPYGEQDREPGPLGGLPGQGPDAGLSSDAQENPFRASTTTPASRPMTCTPATTGQTSGASSRATSTPPPSETSPSKPTP